MYGAFTTHRQRNIWFAIIDNDHDLNENITKLKEKTLGSNKKFNFLTPQISKLLKSQTPLQNF